MIVLLSHTLVCTNVSAWAAADVSASQTVETTTTAKNQSPLPALGAAGIKQAQGFEDSPWLVLGLVAAALVAVWILLDDDEDDEAVASTGT